MLIFRRLILTLTVLCCYSYFGFAQSLLKNTVSIKANRQPLHDVLTIISNESNVTFSYNTKVINRDSLITIQAVNKPLSEVLRMIFNAGYEFKESGSYIIIRRKPIATSTISNTAQTNLDYYMISGFVVDEETGEKIPDATIYEKQHLISAMTDGQGYFSLKLKNKYPNASITVSKNDYRDTAIQVKANYNQKVSIALSRKEPEPNVIAMEEPLIIKESTSEPIDNRVENKWIGKVLLSSKQKLRSLNLKKFYTTRNYQVSVWPGIGTHGKMNAQVVNKFSLNVIGGYAGGVDGFEVGTFFNLIKNDVRGFQVAGLFNIVGGQVKGYQVASLYNETADTVKGMQISGLVNVAKQEVKGMQIASLFNKAKSIKGVQIGFINTTNTQEGTSIGLLNFSKTKKGKRRVAFVVRVPRGK